MKIGVDTGVLIASVKRRGEKFHEGAVRLSSAIKDGGHAAVASSLVLIELPGGLSSSTRMPIDKIFEVEVSVQDNFELQVLPFEDYVDLTVELVFTFRELKGKWGIGSADFHHIATSIEEKCGIFVTVDENHLLRDECKKAFKKYIDVLDPNEAADALRSSGLKV